MARNALTRRGFVAGLGLSAVGVVLAACGGAAPPTQAPAPPAAAPTQAAAAPAPANTVAPAAAAQSGSPAAGEINWLVRTDVNENKGQAEIFEPLLKQQLPNLKITRIVVPSAEYIPKINSMAAAQQSLEVWGF